MVRAPAAARRKPLERIVRSTPTRGLSEYQITVPAPREVWARLLVSDVGAVLTQGPAWFDMLLSTTGGEDASTLYELASGEQLVVPVLQVRKTGPTSGLSLPYGWGYGGAVGAQGQLAQSLIWQDLASRFAWRLRLQPPPVQAQDWAAAAPAAASGEQCRAQLLDLSHGFSSVWSGSFRAQTRNSVRRAEGMNLDISCGSGEPQQSAFAQLYSLSVDRWAVQRGQPLFAARALARRRDRAGMVAAACAVTGTKIWTASLNGEPVAALVVLNQGGTAFAWLSAMDSDLARRTRAGHYLHHLAIKEACAKGALTYHFGESDPGGPVEVFKSRFGARIVDYHVLVQQRLPTQAVAKRFREGAEALLKLRRSSPSPRAVRRDEPPPVV